MILKHIRILSEKYSGGGKVKDCAITVPSNWNQAQRRGILDAAYLAGLNPFTLVHENTAAALYYGLERRDENKTHSVMFINMGATQIQVSVVEYTAIRQSNRVTESFEVLGTSVNNRVGGYYFDIIIAEYFAKEFD